MFTNKGILMINNQTLNYVTDDIRIALLTSAYNLNTKQSVNFLSDVTPYEVTGVTGYARQVITGKSIALDNANNLVNFLTSNQYQMTIPGTITFRYEVVYRHNANPSLAEVIAVKDNGSDIVLTNDVLTLSAPGGVVLQAQNG